MTFLATVGFTQNGNFQAGALSRSLANASLAETDLWSAFNNPAGLAGLTNPTAGIFIENKFNIGELNLGAFALALPVKSGSFALDIYSFNNSIIYSYQKFGFAYGMKLGKRLTAGVQLNYLRTHFESYGNTSAFCGELGLQFKITDKVMVASHIFNPTASSYSDYKEERIPTIMRVGLKTGISPNLDLAFELENGSESGLNLKGGLDYSLSDKFEMLVGVASNPFTNTFGLVFSTSRLKFVFAFQYLQVLGPTPSLSADYIFGELR